MEKTELTFIDDFGIKFKAERIFGIAKPIEKELHFFNSCTGLPLEKEEVIFILNKKGKNMEHTLKVNEIFNSFSGEVGAIPQGHPITVLRLQGCNMDCSFCDTESTKSGIRGADIGIDLLANFISQNNYPILITGGEPYLQKEGIIAMLVYAIERYGFNKKVQIETNGSMPLDDELLKIACHVVDYKMKYQQEMLFDEYSKLSPVDWIKFVISEREQIEAFVDIVNLPLGGRTHEPHFAVSTTDSELYSEICKTILDNQMSVVVNVQLHKHLSVR